MASIAELLAQQLHIDARLKEERLAKLAAATPEQIVSAQEKKKRGPKPRNITTG